MAASTADVIAPSHRRLPLQALLLASPHTLPEIGSPTARADTLPPQSGGEGGKEGGPEAGGGPGPDRKVPPTPNPPPPLPSPPGGGETLGPASRDTHSPLSHGARAAG